MGATTTGCGRLLSALLQGRRLYQLLQPKIFDDKAGPGYQGGSGPAIRSKVLENHQITIIHSSLYYVDNSI